MSDSNGKTDSNKTLLTEGHQPLQKGHTVTNLSNVGDNPPTGGSGLANNSTSNATSSSTADNSESSTSASNSESNKE